VSRIDLPALARAFISEDLTQRIERIWQQALKDHNLQFRVADAVVDATLKMHIEERTRQSPDLRKRMMADVRTEIHSKVASHNPVFHHPACSYLVTERLVDVMEDRKSQASNGDFPRQHGHVLRDLSFKEEDYREFRKLGCHVRMAFYDDPQKEMSLNRQFSVSFIREFGLPGESFVVFNTIDKEVDFLKSIGVKPHGLEPVAELLEVERLRRVVKSEAFKIRDDRGSSYARGAFEMKRRVLNWIEAELELRSRPA
jgi:hypothetical protein